MDSIAFASLDSRSWFAFSAGVILLIGALGGHAIAQPTAKKAVYAVATFAYHPTDPASATSHIRDWTKNGWVPVVISSRIVKQ